MKIAILGMGNIGGGVADVILGNKDAIASACGEEIEIKYVLDLRDFPGHPLEDKIVHDISVIVSDPEVGLVAELMGGSHPAREFTLACLNAKKHVVTSNKEVVSLFGDEFTAAAAENGVHYLFEASVGGGIPLIRPITDCLSSEEIIAIDGIVNGTTNYILTKIEGGTDFEAALSEAQRLGYAERDPSADVDAADAQRKITILSALASGKLAPPELVRAETVRTVTPKALSLAAKCGGTVKLIAHASFEGGRADLFAAPSFVPFSSPLAHVSGVYNGVLLRCSVSGELMFYGSGAGKYPTSGSVMSDIIAAVSGKARRCRRFTRADENDVLPFGEHVCRHFITAPKSSWEALGARVAPEVLVSDGDTVGAILPPCRHGDAVSLTGADEQIAVYRII